MKPLKVCEIEEAVNGKIIRGNPDSFIDNVCTDSRTIKEGDLFIPLKGEKHDAHKFIPEAVGSGAGCVIVDRELKKEYGTAAIIRVDNCNKALQDLAHYYRLLFKDLMVIAITGSSGKTTTKDMIASILENKYSIIKTEGNLNNYFGLPLTLLSLEGDEDIAVLEMGMSKLGEIKLLTEIAEPDIGVITNVGETHLEFLKSVENVARGKSELIAGLKEDGTAVLNFDNKYVREMKQSFKGDDLLYYGLSSQADISAEDIKVNMKGFNTAFKLDYRGEERFIEIFKPGKHNVYNALAAIGVARELAVDWVDIKKGLMSVKHSGLRQEIKKVNDYLIINDTYNANPMSMKAALEVLVDIAEERSIAVLGAMLELGIHEKKAHRDIGQFVVGRNIDILITVGKQGQLIARGAKKVESDTQIYETENNQQAVELINKIMRPGDSVLVKGSRGNKMEEIVNAVCR